MAKAEHRLMTDDTGQDIVNAIEGTAAQEHQHPRRLLTDNKGAQIVAAIRGFMASLQALLAEKKNVQSAKTSPSTSGSDIAFIDTISQNANGEITATRKNVREASASQSGVVSTGTQTIAGNKTMTGSLAFDNVANAIYFKNAQGSYPMIKFAGSSDQWGHGLIMGGGGIVVIGAGESSDTIASGKNAGSEDTYIGADGEVFVYTNVNGGMAGAKKYSFGTSGTFYSQYLDLRGGASATMTASSTNPKITFSENGSQPVHIIYTDYDSYRAPAGLKIIGGDNATPAWFEVEGGIYAGESVYSNKYRDKSGKLLFAMLLNQQVSNITVSANSGGTKAFTLTAPTTLNNAFPVSLFKLNLTKEGVVIRSFVLNGSLLSVSYRNVTNASITFNIEYSVLYCNRDLFTA